jgi:16S rRNA (cytidine1402-2'-O)-methyltransferase
MVLIRKSFETVGPKLYICSTPIGNLEDVSLRLLETLKQVDVLAAEDTRQTRKLLSKYDIHVPQLMSYHQHNAKSRSNDFCSLWAGGKSIAVVSDAGTPGVSDPGEHVIDLAIAQGVPVIPIPGPSAVLSALVGSGLPIQPFAFVGFLPRERKLCMETLERYQSFPGVLAFYEAPHRLQATMERIEKAFPDCNGVLAKELTKKHETFIYGTVSELLDYAHSEVVRGEFVILIDLQSGSRNMENEVVHEEASLDDAIKQVRELMEAGSSHTDAVRQVSKQTGIKKRTLYNETVF